MAETTSVNSQITDSISQANVKVLGDAPALALAALYQTMSNAAAIAAQNAVANQQKGNDLSAAVTTKCINALLGEQ